MRLFGPVQKRIPLTIRDDDRPPFPFTFDGKATSSTKAGGAQSWCNGGKSSSMWSSSSSSIRPSPAGVETIPGSSLPDKVEEVPLGLDDAYSRYPLRHSEAGGTASSARPRAGVKDTKRYRR